MLLCASVPELCLHGMHMNSFTFLPLFYHFPFCVLLFFICGCCSKICGGLFYYIPILELIIGSNLVVACVLCWWCVECYFLQSIHLVIIIYHDSCIPYHDLYQWFPKCALWNLRDPQPFPGGSRDTYIHICNGYSEVYLFLLIKRVMFC
jgi:hypothetical protein